MAPAGERGEGSPGEGGSARKASWGPRGCPPPQQPTGAADLGGEGATGRHMGREFPSRTGCPPYPVSPEQGAHSATSGGQGDGTQIWDLGGQMGVGRVIRCPSSSPSLHIPKHLSQSPSLPPSPPPQVLGGEASADATKVHLHCSPDSPSWGPWLSGQSREKRVPGMPGSSLPSSR